MKTFIVMRFSAMGDVILMLPVLAQASRTYSQHRFVIVTRPKFTVFFNSYPNIECFPVDLNKDYKGIAGLWKLASTLKKKYRPVAVLDLHQHLRTSLLKIFLKPIPAYSLNKGREAKKALTRKKNKERKKLPHATDRYAEVFEKANLPIDLNALSHENLFQNLVHLPLKKSSKWIGIAPFATHKGKILPFDKIEALVAELSKRSDLEILLFGGGQTEEEKLAKLSELNPKVISVAGKYSLQEELVFVSSLDAMICMDSSNMHLAAMAGIPTIAIWGATHSDAGFGPFRQGEENFVQISVDELSCRPCSVYGNKPCFRGDYACLNRIDLEMIIEKVDSLVP